jgi:hypothetical protein
MNELTLLREAGPEAPALTPAARSASRAALLAEIGAGRTTRRLRLPARRRSLRLGAGLVAVAAAWATAVLVAAPGDQERPRGGVEVDGVTLVDFDMPVAPLAFPVPPPGTTGPAFGASGNGHTSMSYEDIEDPTGRLVVHVSRTATPMMDPLTGRAFPGEDVVVDGMPGRVTVLNPEFDDARTAYLEWERTPGQWVTLTGAGRFADGVELASLAEVLVERPQAIPVQLRLAPAGYSLDFVKEGGRIVRLADDSDPARVRGMTVHLPDPALPADVLAAAVAGARSVEDLLLHGQPASLARVDSGGHYESSLVDGGWILQARFPDGTDFVLEAPRPLMQEQVLQIAEQITYTP